MAGALVLCGLFANSAEKAAPQPIKVRWLIAHEPIDAFRRASKIFAEQLKKESNGQMELVVMTPKDFGSTTGEIPTSDIFQLLGTGKVELSQTLTTGIGGIEKNFWVLDLPFLFKSHEHAAKVLEGPIGNQLLASLEKRNVHGLAFTYSGGFRVVPSLNKPIRTADDFKGMKVRTTSSPIAQETLKLLGATPVYMNLAQGKKSMENEKVDAAETTYIRVESVVGQNTKYLNETFHSLFLTSILANGTFYKSLSPENRAALERAALTAARIEREDSINDGIAVRKAFEKKGVEIVQMDPKAEKDFEKRIQPIYTKFKPMFGDLVDQILAQK
jgi:C4-dicarboxylate-binding protein DctP